MKTLALLGAAIAAGIGSLAAPFSVAQRAYRGGTPPRRRGFRNDGLPGGYPGAKLARKAARGQIAIRHRCALGAVPMR